MAKSTGEILAVGRRKCAIARIRLKPGTGVIKVNGKSMIEYFNTEAVCGYIYQPMMATDTKGKFDISASIEGGGVVGQSGALRHGIARALIKYEENLRGTLKSCGMLTRDARVKERKKPGQPGARKRFQFSKR